MILASIDIGLVILFGLVVLYGVAQLVRELGRKRLLTAAAIFS
jgi:hypothetical protein